MATLQKRLESVSQLLTSFHSASVDLEAATNVLLETFTRGGKVLVCGNGGSAAEAQHFSAEFVNSFVKGSARPSLPVLSLTCDSSILTSISNDYAFDEVFAKQVRAYGLPGDLLIAFTTSGDSINCVNAVQTAQEMGISSIAFTRSNAKISRYAEVSIKVPSTNTQLIQECHLIALHYLVEQIELHYNSNIKESPVA